MKKFFVFAAAAALALCACDKNDPQVEGSGDKDNQQGVAGLVLNELSGADKFIELYNTTDKEVSLEGVYLVKYDSSKEGGKSTTWTGAKGMKIAAKGFVVLESSDLADEAEGGDPSYAYESANHVFKGGLSGKKNVFIGSMIATSIVNSLLAPMNIRLVQRHRVWKMPVFLAVFFFLFSIILPPYLLTRTRGSTRP